MAFGDIIQKNNGTTGAITFLAPVTAGNSIVLAVSFRASDGGIPSSISDDVNTGNYLQAVLADTTAADPALATIWTITGALAGTPIVSTAGTAAWRWTIYEVEGTIQFDASGAGLNYVAGSSVSTTSAATANSSVSFGMAQLQFNSRTLAPTQAGWTKNTTGDGSQVFSRFEATGINADLSGPIGGGTSQYTAVWASFTQTATGPDYTQRKGSTFDATHTLGTITTATLNAAAITINTTGAGTVNLTDTSGITTSGVYNLVLGDGAATQTYTVQLNVIGLPVYTLNKDGAALGALTGIKAVVTATAELNGTELYSANNLTATAGVMDSGIYPGTGAVADVVTVSILTSSGDGITFSDALEQF
jgi:hypothetical protein